MLNGSIDFEWFEIKINENFKDIGCLYLEYATAGSRCEFSSNVTKHGKSHIKLKKGCGTIHVVTKMGNVGNSKYGYTNVLWCSTI